jgi:chromosome segregation ATPase
MAFKYVLVQQRKAYETINAQSLLLQQLSGEAKRHDALIQDLQQRLELAARDAREGLERNARLEKANVQLSAALSVQQEARHASDARATEQALDLQSLRASLETKASAAELAELVHILQRLQANKAEKTGLAEVAQQGAAHAERLHELGAQLNHVAQTGLQADAQLGEQLTALSQKVAALPTQAELELKAGRAEMQQQLANKADRADAKKLQSDVAVLRADQDALKKTSQIMFETLSLKVSSSCWPCVSIFC